MLILLGCGGVRGGLELRGRARAEDGRRHRAGGRGGRGGRRGGAGSGPRGGGGGGGDLSPIAGLALHASGSSFFSGLKRTERPIHCLDLSPLGYVH